MASVSNVVLSLQSGTDRTVTVTWKCTLSNIDYFRIVWHYSTGDGVGVEGADNQYSQAIKGTGYNDTYTAPSNATHVRCWIRPYSTTHEVNGEEVEYWTGTWTQSEEDYWFSWNAPEVPDTPSVEMGSSANSDGQYKLTATLDDIRDDLTDYIEFSFRKNGKSIFSRVIAAKSVHRNTTAYAYVSPGATYAVTARAINSLSSGTKSKLTLIDGSTVTVYNPQYSDWASFSEEVSPPPDYPTNFKVSANDTTVVKATWTKSTGATGYEIEYSKEKAYLEKSSNDTQTYSTDEDVSTAYITGLDSGEEWFFKIRATNDSGESGWSSIVSTILGSKPEAPTTWSTTSTAIVGETVNLYWVHNCEDGSDQTAAQVRITPSIGSQETINISDDTTSYSLSTSKYSDGVKITWMVRTAGITGEYGDWSTARTIQLYSAPGVSIEMGEKLTSLPFTIVAEASPTSQKAISYYLSVTALSSYEVTGPTGETLRVNSGEEVYSKLYNTSSDTLSTVTMSLSVGDVTLADGQEYKVTVTVVMNSGLSAEVSSTFTVKWDSALYEPYAAVTLDSDNCVAYIAPYCEELVNFQDGDDPDTADRELVTGITLAVYRREADGKFTLIGDGIENTGSATITDPHPALDYARYRIVVQDDDTGQISYEDLPALPFNCPYVVIQWDEDWTDFDYDEPAKMVEQTWSGSMIKIRGNVDVSESHSPDTELVEYIGRSHPVGYYGTQLGESGSWSVDVPKDDEETIYALRRLAVYMGDVYVREPSGTGYWAQITVSMNTNHCETVVPVTLSISRVEGGM